MRKRKVAINLENEVFKDKVVRISREGNEHYFEIGKELTNDLSEAVALMMRQKNMWNSPSWDLEIQDISLNEISPEKALFWLTGGYNEWKSMEHYKKSWADCYLDFQEEFGVMVVNIVRRSKNLKEIRDSFIKYLNLPILYEFAIKKDIAR